VRPSIAAVVLVFGLRCGQFVAFWWEINVCPVSLYVQIQVQVGLS
jgi:hypothetical protein